MISVIETGVALILLIIWFERIFLREFVFHLFMESLTLSCLLQDC